MTALHKLVVYLALLGAYVSAWRSSSVLPWGVRSQKKPIDVSFYKFWMNSVFDGLMKYDYDTWFSRFVDFPPSLKETVGSKLSCPVFHNRHKPSSVHRLTPGDITIVASIGDSTTAGFSARSKGIFDLFVEFRGISWSIGGKGRLEEVTTLPNILKKYNPLVTGFSTRTTPVSKRKDFGSGNNFAKSGATAESLSEQAEELVSHLKENKEISFHNDWKLITVYIGAEDLCMACFDHDLALKSFAKRVSHTLAKIREKIPRVLVNIVQVFDVTEYSKQTSTYCQSFLKVTCPCAVGRHRASVSRLAKQYSTFLTRLVNSPKYRDTQDFAVVLQPFLSGASLPKTLFGKVDYSFFAPDCFHFSAKGHAALAISLWNNMLQPVGVKKTNWHVSDKLRCPRPEFPFIFTKTNSKEYLSARPQISPLKRQEQEVRNGMGASEKEHQEGGQGRSEVGRQSVAIAIGSGLAVVALAVGVVIFVVRRRQNGGLLAGGAAPNYQTVGEETRL